MEGNTEYAAEKIASELGAETLRIEPVKAYPTKGFRKFLWGGKSAVMAEKPKLLPYKFNTDAYDRIIFGFPVWAGNITPPIRTFVIENNLKGKRIAAFACQSGSGAEKALAKLAKTVGIDDFEKKAIFIDPKTRKSEDMDAKIGAFCKALNV
jgi:flavodoxin